MANVEWNEDWQHFWDDGCDTAIYEGHGFLIVPDWDVVNHPDFEAFLSYATQVDMDTVESWRRSDYWGFGDQYMPCSDCQALICHQPSSGPSDAYWINESWGDILCKKCTQEHADDYVEWYQEEVKRRVRHGKRMIGFILEPEEYGFVLVLPNLANGFHHGDNDDPFALVRWTMKHSLDIAIKVFADPFTANFDVYMRRWDDDGEVVVLTDAEVAEIREALCEWVDINPYHSYVTLRREFREWPDLATRMEAMLRGQG